MSHIAENSRVQAAFYFEIEIDGTVISFQEVSGLSQKNEVIAYRHGDSKLNTKDIRVGLSNNVEFTCKKGVFITDDLALNFYNKTFDKAYMSTTDEDLDINIRLLDENGDVVTQWTALSCIVVSFEAPTMKSDDNSAAIESITFQATTFSGTF
jgi:phage tail-like protein